MQALKLNSKLIKLTQLLQDGSYHDGSSLGAALKLTRSAVWKQIKKLQNYGINIQSLKSKGYVLNEPLALMNKKEIAKYLSAKLTMPMEIFEFIHSTNDYLKPFFASLVPRICIAEMQTQGRGRLQRNWYSPFAQNLYFSYLHTLQKDISELAGLSLVACLSVIKTLQTLSNATIEAKWPNDILYQGEKLAGILIEVQAETNGSCHVIIGIGINVNMLEAKTKIINKSWTSLRKMTNAYINRNKLCATLIEFLLADLARFEKEGLKNFISAWNAKDCLHQTMVSLQSMNAKEVVGIAMGVDHKGRLLLQLLDGSIHAFSAGEVSVNY